MQLGNNHQRRTFLRNMAAGACALGAAPIGLSAFTTGEKAKKVSLKQNDVILFQGDSITDWYRKHDVVASNESLALGSGYVNLTASRLLCDHPQLNLKIFNKGVSGNTVPDLAERWDTDCLALKPTVLSILIGVNDYFVKRRDNKGDAATYREGYRRLLERTMNALPETRLIIAEPFVIKGLLYVDDSWFPAFNEYRQISRELADQFNATFVPLFGAIENALKRAPNSWWSNDGLHASMAGAQVMADTWLKAFEK